MTGAKIDLVIEVSSLDILDIDVRIKLIFGKRICVVKYILYKVTGKFVKNSN